MFSWKLQLLLGWFGNMKCDCTGCDCDNHKECEAENCSCCNNDDCFRTNNQVEIGENNGRL